jgi:hypothetical protein
MNRLSRFLIVSCGAALIWSGSAKSQHVYGDTTAEDVPNVGMLEGHDPPPTHNRATGWPWLPPCNAYFDN